MRREHFKARDNWRETVIAQGLSFPVTKLPDGNEVDYWCDDAAYVFTLAQIEKLESVTAELWEMSLAAVDKVLTQGSIAAFGLPESSLELLRWSWETKQPSVYGRFDVAWDGRGNPKLLEFNGDTPTGLIESSICQWYWLQDQKPDNDQFNSLHERLVRRWKDLTPRLPIGGVHFAYVYDGAEGEDWVTTEYLRDTCVEAGLATHSMQLTDLGWDDGLALFVDEEDRNVTAIFKLYPWEDMLREQFAPNLWASRERTRWFEPAWKAILSNKALLAVLWEMYEGHPLLLPAYLDGPRALTEYVEKPLHGREGDGVTLHTDTGDVRNARNAGGYGEEGFCYQQFHQLPTFDGAHPVLGLWLVDGNPAGLGIRESESMITDYYARFVPHYIADGTAPSPEQSAAWIDEDYPRP